MDDYFDFDPLATLPSAVYSELSPTYMNAFDSDKSYNVESLFLDEAVGRPVQQTDQPLDVTYQLISNCKANSLHWQHDPPRQHPTYKANTAGSTRVSSNTRCDPSATVPLYTGCVSSLEILEEGHSTCSAIRNYHILDLPYVASDDEEEQKRQGRMIEMQLGNQSPLSTNARERKPGSRFRKDAVKILKQWLSEHSDHPYPNEKEKTELKRLTGIKRSQISNWFANARRRGKVLSSHVKISPDVGAVNIPTHNNLTQGYKNLGPMDRWKCSPPETEPARMTDIVHAITSNYLPQDGRCGSLRDPRTLSQMASSEADSLNQSAMFQSPSESSFGTRNSTSSSISLASSQSYPSRPLFASPQGRRRRQRISSSYQKHDSSSKKSLSNTKNNTGIGRRERVFQCTFCTEIFCTKYDWQRHEKSLHLALDRWICCPWGLRRVDPRTGIQQCAFCDKLEPTKAHLEQHDYQACREKSVSERTFYRKDHLRQHLRLMHGDVKYQSHMESWKSTTVDINSRCGFCQSLFTTWQSRADHLAAHFKGGAEMADWSGGWGFDPCIEKLVENALPPYLIGFERGSMNPYRARAISNPALSMDKSPSFNTLAECDSAGLSGNEGSDWRNVERIEVDQTTKENYYWTHIEDELAKFVLEQRGLKIAVDDQMLQNHARLLIYGDPDPWDYTLADNTTWLEAFKLEHGLNPDQVVQ